MAVASRVGGTRSGACWEAGRLDGPRSRRAGAGCRGPGGDRRREAGPRVRSPSPCRRPRSGRPPWWRPRLLSCLVGDGQVTGRLCRHGRQMDGVDCSPANTALA